MMWFPFCIIFEKDGKSEIVSMSTVNFLTDFSVEVTW